MMRGPGRRGGAGGPGAGLQARARCRARTWRGWSRRPSGSSRERGAFRADQFQLAGNFRAHYLHTGPGDPGPGRGPPSTASATSPAPAAASPAAPPPSRRQNPATRCFLVEPEGAAVLAGQPVTQPEPPHPGRRLRHRRPAASPPGATWTATCRSSGHGSRRHGPGAGPDRGHLRRLLVRRQRGGRQAAAGRGVPGQDRGGAAERFRSEIPQHQPLGGIGTSAWPSSQHRSRSGHGIPVASEGWPRVRSSETYEC